MSKYSKAFHAHSDCVLATFPTDISDTIEASAAKEDFKKTRKKLAELQDVMYAHNKYNVLICIQGMDTAGKDSLIRELFEKFNARGVEVSSFKTPSSKELQHDYLWRHAIATPARGKFGVFNRTHYENVLVTRVHPDYILKENIPGIDRVEDISDKLWQQRYQQINAWEKHLSNNGTIIFKFYLHLSNEQQKERLLRRLEKPKHNWKFSPGDLAERKLWDQYMEAYQETIQQTSTKHAPWYLVPADDKDICRQVVAKILWERLSQYKDIQYPELDDAIQSQLQKYKKELLEG